MKAIAIDIGGSHTACAVIEDDRILGIEQVGVTDTANFAALLPALSAACGTLLKRCGAATTDCAGVAVSFPGIVDPFSGRVLSTPQGKYDDAKAVDLPAWCRQCFGLRLAIDNDARMALLGEQYCGAARGFADVAMLTFGTGVGGAVMLDGRLLRGRHLQAALSGHLPVRFDGRACICGGTGCVEAEASTWALPEICRAWPGFERSALAREAVIDFATLFRCCRSGDAVACAVRDRCVAIWAAGAVGVIHAFDPQLLVLGGAVMQSADQVLPSLKAHVEARAWTPWGNTELRKAKLGADAGLLGAVPLLGELC